MFGPYRLLSLIGRGGMGEVHRAFDTRRNREVAVKRLAAGLITNPNLVARFRAEADIVARLNEPHIIPIHDFGEIDGQLFIDMRLVEGCDLAALVARDGPLTPRRAVNVVSQVAAALDAAHRAGLVHRDIKPGNALVVPGPPQVEDGDFVYVADFGIARATDTGGTSLTATGSTVGSPHYMAPERFVDGHGDHRVDVYALGCLLHEALTGVPPFPVEGLPALINAHLNTPPPRPSDRVPGLPPGLDAVVARAMAKHPDQRFASAGALALAAREAVMYPQRPAPPTAAPWSSGPWPPAGPSQPVRGPQDRVAPFAGYPSGPAPAGPPSGPAPTRVGAPAVPPRSRVARPLMVVGAVLVLLGGLFAVYTATRPGDGGTVQAGAPDPSAIRAEPVGTAGDNPFMPKVGDDVPGVVAVAGTGGRVAGDLEGLYGGTRKKGSCDPAAIVSFLAANPDKARAWAGVEGIAPDGIAGFVAGLTPVVLRADVAVTNHGFAKGAATEVASVLQAGTAVLVDARGVPRVRCACGNPLTEPAPVTAPRLTGTTWPGLTTDSLTSVTAASAALERFTLVDPATQAVFYRPVGGTGAGDVPKTTETVPLYRLPSSSDAVGSSGVQADPALTGVPGSTNTGFWVGCEGTPATTRFTLDRTYAGASGTFQLASFTPAGLAIDVRLRAGDREVYSGTLQAGSRSAFDVDVTDADELVLTARAVQGTCTSAPVGYGVAVDAAVTR